jgi:3-deoxy-D-manno-octulosonic-acid transferase
MIFGPNMQNFGDTTRNFLRQGGALQVRGPEELEKVLGELLADEKRRAELGRNALKVVRENLGAVERTVEMILENLKGSGIYFAPEK